MQIQVTENHNDEIFCTVLTYLTSIYSTSNCKYW